MKKNQLTKLLQNKMVLAALLMVLVAGTAAAGMMALQGGESENQPEETDPGYAFQTQGQDEAENQQLALPTEEALEGLHDVEELQNQEPGKLVVKDPSASSQQPVQSGQVDAVIPDVQGEVVSPEVDVETLVDGENAVVYEPETEAQEVNAEGAALNFQAGSTISWPVEGNIILDYSMDTTIYFPTLEQYKCNPGIMIQAEVGQDVEAAVRGVVTAIGSDEELGNFIMMDLSDDYSIVYGQLENIAVSIGQLVESGQVLGTVAQPTKYYVVEGPNIYLEMRYQQKPVDPLDYIR